MLCPSHPREFRHNTIEYRLWSFSSRSSLQLSATFYVYIHIFPRNLFSDKWLHVPFLMWETKFHTHAKQRFGNYTQKRIAKFYDYYYIVLPVLAISGRHRLISYRRPKFSPGFPFTWMPLVRTYGYLSCLIQDLYYVAFSDGWKEGGRGGGTVRKGGRCIVSRDL